jgi:hypothetical protein
MNNVRRFAVLAAGLLAALLLIAAVDASPASASPPVTTSSDSVLQNDSLTVSGKGCSVPEASPTTVQVDLVNAFGDDEFIDTMDVASGNALPDASGDWSISIHVKATAQSGPYDLFAACMNGRVPATWTLVFAYADGLITVGPPTKTTAPAPAPAPTTAVVAKAPAALSSSSATHARTSAPARSSSAPVSVAAASSVTAESAPASIGADGTTAPGPTTSPAVSTAAIGLAVADQRVATTPSVLAHNRSSDAGFPGWTIAVIAGVIVAAGASVFLWRRRRGLPG